MCSLVYDFFELILIVFQNSVSNTVSKGLEFAQTSIKKGFELLLRDKKIRLIFYLPLVFLLVNQGYILKKSDCKRYSVVTISTNSCKIVLALLEKVITLQVGLSAIHVWKLGLQRRFGRAFIHLKSGNGG